MKLHTAEIARIFGLLSPLAAVLLLVTGIANIHNRFLGSTGSWYAEGWLVAKVILYVVMVFNGMVYGPGLTRSRVKIFKSQIEQTASPDAGAQIRSINKQLTLFYLVQVLLLLLIV
jgi:apolipoprotein N-acyltransferase